MNPFSKYPGLKLNGSFYPKEELQGITKDESFKSAILGFASELFYGEMQVEVKTSGSTGPPKILRFPKTAFEQSAQATNTYFELDIRSRALLSLPLEYIAGKMMVARAIVGGYELISIEPSSNPLKHIDSRLDLVPLTPFQLHSILKSNPEKTSGVERFLIGGGAISIELEREIIAKNLPVFSSFGMAETLSHFALGDVQQGFPVKYEPLPGVKIGEMDGCLTVEWLGITEGVLQTNDLVRLDKGKFEWLGRADNLINSGGIKIIPELIEKEISKFLDRTFFIAGLPNEKLGEEAVLFVEGEELIDLSKWSPQIKYHKPKRVVYLEAFEYTFSGKLKRAETVKKWRDSSRSGN